MGGGEVVACYMARMLKDLGFNVTFVSGKKVSKLEINNKLGINLDDITFIEIWNDEVRLKEVVQGKDLFINTTFMDYSCGYAKRNIYYTHFPTEAYTSFKGMIFNNYLLPLVSNFIKPQEFTLGPRSTTIINGRYSFLLDKANEIGFSYLKKGKKYIVKFIIFIDKFYKKGLEDLKINISDSDIIKKTVKIMHNCNTVKFQFVIRPKRSTAFLRILLSNNLNNTYLLFPKILPGWLPNIIYKIVYERIYSRLRAGLFINVKERLKSYDLIFANSSFTKLWVKKYWNRDAQILYPPVKLLLNSQVRLAKNNQICSVGRFFMRGHGKKQEIMIRAFKLFYDAGFKSWSLHLVGGVGNEPGSLHFLNTLIKKSEGYPIHFHVNASRKVVEKILSTSKIYWHATGYGENERKDPIKFEHFGIAPIEAISAGCIPLLYKGGGLKELIPLLGYTENNLYTTIPELVKKTKILAPITMDHDEENRLSQKLKFNFSQSAFISKFLSHIN